jgi:hypothetical protein
MLKQYNQIRRKRYLNCIKDYGSSSVMVAGSTELYYETYCEGSNLAHAALFLKNKKCSEIRKVEQTSTLAHLA